MTEASAPAAPEPDVPRAIERFPRDVDRAGLRATLAGRIGLRTPRDRLASPVRTG